MDLHTDFLKTLSRAINDIKSDKREIVIPDKQGYLKSGKDMICHSYHELFIQTDGYNTIRMNNETIVMSPGDILLMPSGTAHEEINQHKAVLRHLVVMFAQQRIYLHFGTAKEGQTPNPEIFSIYDTTMDNTIYQFLDFLIKNKNNKDILQGTGLTIISILKQFIKQNKTIKTKKYPIIEKIRQIIAERLSDSTLNVSYIASMVQYNSDYLSHIFKRETGKSLNNYITEQRMKAAVNYLFNTSMTIDEITWACGFKSTAYFIAQFKKHHATTPARYRKNNPYEKNM